MRSIETIAVAFLWLAAAVAMPMAALTPVQAPPSQSGAQHGRA